MGRLLVASVVSIAAIVAAVWASVAWGWGETLPLYNVSFVGLGLAMVAGWRFLLLRRVASWGLAFTGVAAILTGFWLLYWKDDLKLSGLKDIAKFWHSFASMAMVPFFAAHYVRNQPRLLSLGDKLRGWQPVGWGFVGAWTGVFLVGTVTWAPDHRALFTEENYLLLVSWTWVLVVGAVYASWGVAKWMRMTSPTMRAALTRNRRRALVDWTLLLSFVTATLSGLALLYFKAFLHGNGYKYVSKYWHSATSVAFTVFVVLHVGANLYLLLAHGRRLRDEATGT